jgi:hypothetical protein
MMVSELCRWQAFAVQNRLHVLRQTTLFGGVETFSESPSASPLTTLVTAAMDGLVAPRTALPCFDPFLFARSNRSAGLDRRKIGGQQRVLLLQRGGVVVAGLAAAVLRWRRGWLCGRRRAGGGTPCRTLF